MADEETPNCLSHSYRDFNIGGHARVHLGDNHYAPDNRSERLETPPRPCSNVPFRRDPDFIERGHILDEVHAKLSRQAARVAIVGLGGVGKSQLAIEYSYRTTDLSPDTWVLWIHASNAARFEQGVQEIADLVKIRRRQDPNTNILKLFRNWLRDTRNGRWLVILDNADEIDFLVNPSALEDVATSKTAGESAKASIFQHIPVCDHGAVLITSRSKASASRLVDDRDILIVKPMDRKHATTLLEKKLALDIPVEQKHQEKLEELVETLEGMPLAITQAAAFIRQREPRCSISRYIEMLEKSDGSKTSLLNRDNGDLRRDNEAKNSIIATWQVSFDHIYQTRQSAAHVLSLMSFFDRQAIPEALLSNADRDFQATSFSEGGGTTDCHDADSDGEGSDPEPDAEQKFEDDIKVLLDYRLISATTETDSFDMHRLVQLATQRWLHSQKQHEYWKAAFIERLQHAFPWAEYSTWQRCQRLFPHLKAAIPHKPAQPLVLLLWASLLDLGSDYMLYQGRLQEAESLIVPAMEIYQDILGSEHRVTLATMSSLSSVYLEQEEFKKAKKLAEQSYLISKKALRPEDTIFLKCMAQLAQSYYRLHDLKAAEELQVQVLEGLTKVFGAGHCRTLTGNESLAAIYTAQRKWAKAEELELQQLASARRQFGSEHPATLTAMNNLAAIYLSQGRSKKAEKLTEQTVETGKAILGPEHPLILSFVSNLGHSYIQRGHLEKAEDLLARELERCRKVFGCEHPSMWRSMNTLAQAHFHRGRLKEAEIVAREELESRLKVLGADHPGTLRSMYTLVQILSRLEVTKSVDPG